MKTLGMINGLPGLFVAGVFSAALSSLSTGLNSLACILCEDVIKPLVRQPLSDKQTVMLLRCLTIVFGVLCIALVFVVEKLGMVLQLASMIAGITMGPLLAIYTIGVCAPWLKSKVRQFYETMNANILFFCVEYLYSFFLQSVLTGGIVSFLTLSWMCAQAQIAEMQGTMKHPKLPVSIEGCPNEWNLSSLPQNSSIYE